MAPVSKAKGKSRPTKMTTQTLLDFDLGESSSDSDFRIEDHDDESDDDDDCSETGNSNADGSGSNDDRDNDESDSESGGSVSSELKYLLGGSPKTSKDTKDLKDILTKAAAAATSMKDKLPTNPICCACLGDRSDDTNEIVECDGCGVSVHEGCYGVSDSNSVSSTVSSCSTEPWFCEACRANILDPSCELCPNKGGIFKETDVGKWVHLICALYVPGVAFGEVDQLSSVTLFEMPYSKWGAKTCSLCEDARFARTGVCIGCDAGMCKTYFHVTCAQAAGFLSEAHSEEVDHADPFYAHCKVHSDKTMIKHRKRNYNTLKLRMQQKKLEKLEQKSEKSTTEQLRIQRKLIKYQTKYKNHKGLRNEPWVPTQKMPRLLTTSATACKRLMLKAELMGIDTAALEFQEIQMAALSDVRKKWHVPPAFSVEFIGYYLDRISRLKDLKSSLEHHLDLNGKLLNEQQTLREEYDQKIKTSAELTSKNAELKKTVTELHKQIEALCPNKSLPSIENIGRQILTPTPVPSPRPMSVPTAAALKMGVGFPLTNLQGKKDDSGRVLSTQRQNNDLLHKCGICKRCNDQHLLAKCDTCRLYYHLGCLNPPLTRHPKKSKLYGWQCSECDKSDDSDVADIPKGPRKSRTRFSKDGSIVPVDPNLFSNSSDGITSLKADDTSPKRKLSTDSKPPKRKDQPDNPRSIETQNSNDVQKEKLASNMEPEQEQEKSLMQQGKNKKIKMSSPNSPLKQQINTNAKDGIKEENQRRVSVGKEGRPSNDLKINTADDSVTEESATESVSSKTVKNKGQTRKRAERRSTTTTDTEAKDDVDKPLIKDQQKGSLNIGGKSQSQQELKENGTKDENIGTSVTSEKPLSTIEMNASTVIGGEENVDQSHKQNRKRRKEKHKRQYNSDSEKASSKEHKRKRKKKSHDRESATTSDSVPKIKIKFKTLPLPGEATPEAQFFYVPADMVRPLDTSRPTSVETVDESTMNTDDMNQQVSPKDDKRALTSSISTLVSPTVQATSPSKGGTTDPKLSGKIKAKPISRASSPRKSGKRASTSGNPPNAPGSGNTLQLVCDVCKHIGSTQNLVKCDECGKNYHFICLDPPLKKTPKRRGYSWHCADCDPTEVEST